MARAPRFFISPDQVNGRSVTLTGDDVRHIATVLRMKPGEELVLCDGAGTDYRIRIASIDRTSVTAEITDRIPRQILKPRVTLGQGIPKADKMDWIMQKATELGVASIIPLMTERTVVKVRDEQKRAARWQRICREAAMQSDRPDIPLVGPIRQFEAYVRSLSRKEETLLLLPWEEAGLPVKNVLRSDAVPEEIVVLIGPEGGFSRVEAESARDRGFHAVRIGPNIMRTETAAIAVLSMIGYEYFSPI